MKKHRKRGWIVLLGFVTCVFACVTINIYFPAEKVESVAGEIVKDVRGPSETPSKGDKTSQDLQLINVTNHFAYTRKVWMTIGLESFYEGFLTYYLILYPRIGFG